MGLANRKRRTCRHCGRDMGQGEFVEIRVLDWKPSKVLSHTRWTSKTMMTEYVCPICAIGAVDRIKEQRDEH